MEPNGPIFCGAAWYKPGDWSIFRGAVQDELCVIQFRMHGAKRLGFALLDTAAQSTAISRRFAEESGLKLSGMTSQIRGVGCEYQTAPWEEISIELIADAGRDIPICDFVSLANLPDSVDLLIGMPLLTFGTLTIDGPRDRWEWKVQNLTGKVRKKPLR